MRWGSPSPSSSWRVVPDPTRQTRAQAAARLELPRHDGCFFLVEIGDKTQIATVALAARFESLTIVTLGTTLGMLIANAPVCCR